MLGGHIDGGCMPSERLSRAQMVGHMKVTSPVALWPERSRCLVAGCYYGLCCPNALWLGAALLIDQLIKKVPDSRVLLTNMNDFVSSFIVCI